MTDRTEPILARAPGATGERMGDRTLIVDEAGREATTLNPVGSIVWWALDGQTDAEALAQQVVLATTAQDAAAVRRDVAAFLADLVDAGLAVPVRAAG